MTKGMAARAGFFSKFLGSNHKGNGGIRRGRGPCRPLNGRQAPVAPGVGDRPLSPVGGATCPPFFFSRDFVANLERKNYTLDLSPYGRATGVCF